MSAVTASPVDIRGVALAPAARIWPPLIALWIIWGSTYLAIAVVATSMPVLLSMGLRFVLAAAILAAVLAVWQGPGVLRVPLREVGSTSVMGSILLGLCIGNLALAEQHVPSGVAALLIAVSPLWIVLFRYRSGESPSVVTLVGVAVGLTGLALMLLPGGTKPVAGSDDTQVFWWSVSIVVGAFFWSAVSWRSARWALPANSLVGTCYQLLAGGLTGVVLGLVLGERLDLSTQYTASAWVAWTWLVVASVVAYAAYSWLLQNAPMSLVTTYTYVNPVVAVILGAILIGEAITRDVVLGLTVTVGGVVLVIAGEREHTHH